MLVEDAIQVVEEWIQDLPEDVQTPRSTSQPTAQIFKLIFLASAICGVQLIAVLR